jgi:uncharacterized membrane protein
MVIDILLVIIILQIGLTSGLLFIFAFAVNPGLARLSEEEYFRAMKYINIVILNPIFFLVFMGPLITMPILTYMSWNDSSMFILIPISTILYLLGVLLITTIKNVPLNNKLEKLSSTEFKGVFIWYRKPWNFWHNIRTFFSMISFLMLIIYSTF